MSVSTHFARPLARVLRARRLDAEAILGLSPNRAGELPERIAYAEAVRAWERAADASGDPAIGLHAAAAVLPGDYGVLEFLARASPTPGAAFARLARFHRLMNDGAGVELGVRGRRASLRYLTPSAPPMPRAYLEFVLATWVRFAREMTEIAVPFCAVLLPFPAPEDAAPYLAAFGDGVEFGAGVAELHFDRELLERAVPRADAALVEVLDRHAEGLLAQSAGPTGEPWPARVAAEVRRRLPDGSPRLAPVAEALALSPRQLRRALEGEGTGFAAIVDEVRRAAALELIDDASLSLGEIAFLTGFSEPSAFHRAFRRWTGRTPRGAAKPKVARRHVGRAVPARRTT